MPDKQGYEWGVGRRKTAVARVRIRKGTGKCTVNKRDYKEYFPHQRLQMLVTAPLTDRDRRLLDELRRELEAGAGDA